FLMLQFLALNFLAFFRFSINKIFLIFGTQSYKFNFNFASQFHTKLRDKPLGSFGHFATFSFHETKNIISGEGGMLISILFFIYIIYSFIKYCKGEIVILGWTSLIISVWFLSGLIIFILGIIGLYIGKTFEKVKNRPVYIIDKKFNFNE
ncbi:MAG: DegT/DnrJ/EryC1/StrS family aminotransferase, partial [Bacteroidia bacterium]|nr:DegT/DnrJ/EryC1/StrS family aminotransferase [Bacteroidia bacterium]